MNTSSWDCFARDTPALLCLGELRTGASVLRVPDKRVLLAGTRGRATPLRHRAEPGPRSQRAREPRPRGRQAADAAPGMARAPRSPFSAPGARPAPPRPSAAAPPHRGPRGGRCAARSGRGAGAGGARRWRRGRAAAGAGGCGMAEPPGAPHRTTGSTLLHPLSALLGIPLDQVRLRAPAAPSARSPGRQPRQRRRCHAVPAPGASGAARRARGRSGFGRGSGSCHRGSVSFFPAMPGAFRALARRGCWMLLDAVSRGAGLSAAEFGMLQGLAHLWEPRGKMRDSVGNPYVQALLPWLRDCRREAQKSLPA